MADIIGGYTDVQYLCLVVMGLVTLIAGLVIHSFIIGVNVTDWWKGRPVMAVDQIITSLGIPRMFTQCIVTLFVFQVRLLTILNSLIPAFILSTVYVFFCFTNIWLTYLLSIVFCLKIFTFHSRLFLYLRGVIVQKTVYFIAAAVLLTTVVCLMHLTKAITDVTEDGANNVTIYNLSSHRKSITIIYNYLFVGATPMLFCCISSLFLFSSLYHHTARMKKSSNLAINLETYYSVLKLISFTFIYVIIYYVGQSILTLYYLSYFVNLLWFRIVIEFLPVLHTCYLIYRTPKLRSQLSKVLQIVTDFLFQRKYTEPGENIQM